MIQELLTPNQVGCNFGAPDNGFCGFDLAEERTDVAELVMSPVLQQACCLRGNLPLADRELPPSVHQLATSLIRDVSSYCWSVVESPLPSSRRFSSLCFASARRLNAWERA